MSWGLFNNKSVRVRPQLEDLEPRVLYSADAAALLGATDTLSPVAEVRMLDLSVPAPVLLAPVATQTTNQEIVFVNTDVHDYQSLIDDITQNADSTRHIQVVLLDSHQNGIDQISATLQNQHDLSAIHIISHGTEYGVNLGNSFLNSQTLEQNSTTIANWGQALGDNGDILLYGCDVAQTDVGKGLVNGLANLTHADVAASDDLTASAVIGGDWDLEYKVGQVETRGVIDKNAPNHWVGYLASLTVDTTSDVSDGNTSSIAALLGSKGADGKISLREAITAANNTSGTDTINFSIGTGVQTITVTSTLTINSAIIIDGTTQSGYVAGSTLTIILDGNGGNYDGLTLNSNSDGSTIKGLVIRDFGGDGIQIAAGSDNNTIIGNFIGGMTNTGTASGTDDNGGSGINVVGANNTIGGTTVAERNVISANTSRGIYIVGATATGNTVKGNYIGLTAAGTATLGNGSNGVRIETSADLNTVGGNTAAERNVISGNNNDGIRVRTNSNLIQGNYIGTDFTGTVDLGNTQAGIEIDNGGSSNSVTDNLISGNNASGIELGNSGGDSPSNTITFNLIGTKADGISALGNTLNGLDIGNGGTANDSFINDNTIAFNGGDGISLVSSTGIFISQNSIFSNTGLGIDLTNNGVTANDAGDGDTGANNLQNFPVLISAVVSGTSLTIVGTLNSNASSNFRVEFFSSVAQDATGFGEGQTYLGAVTVITNGAGNGTFNTTLTGVTVPAGRFISATAINTTTSNSSEFSQNVVVTGNTAPSITSNGGGATASISVSENTSAVTAVTATDSDLPAQALTYSLSGVDAALFGITGGGTLTFLSAPNFEVPTDVGTNNVYNVTVQVSDGSLTDTQAIAVTVTAVNDNIPTITSNGAGTTASISVAENSTAVTTVTATDADLPAQTLTYVLGGADAGKFSITAGGVLTFNTAPNFEAPTDVGANNIYNVTVTVSDGTLADLQAISVSVTNVNETPTITSNGAGASASISVAENGTAVTTVTATDPDASPTLSYSIIGGLDASQFSINSSTGVLTFMAAPNFEVPTDSNTNNIYHVDVQVSDGALTDTQTINVTVTNVNEAPTISSGSTASVAENSTAVMTVVASDPDASTTLTYALSGVDATKFSISAGGVITFLSAPNFEVPTDVGTDNIYNVTVTVSDGTLTASQAIAVTVTNVNEVPTVTSAASASVAENTATATTVYTATSTDPDAVDTVAWSLSGTDAAAFTINASGQLKFVSSPDFETKNSYSVNVIATDAGSLTASKALTISVTNVNEAPTITSGTSATVAENIATSTTVYTATRTDPDAGDTVAWNLAGTDAAAFTINASGQIQFVSSPDFETKSSYNVIVIAIDSGSLFAVKPLSLTVTNVNEAPTISSGASASIAENTTAVTTVTATDPDASPTFTYSISGGVDAARFSINATTGALSFVAAPDFETPTDTGTNNVYNVTIQVSDSSLTASQAIAVTVSNVNEAPTISSGAIASVAENTTAVMTVVASDPDASTTLSYGLSGADAAKFGISAGGVITFLSAPNFEAPTDSNTDNIYSVTVTVSDGALTASKAIGATVTNVNEAPVAANDAAAGSANTTLIGNVFTNDSDEDGDVLTPVLVSLPTNGLVSWGASGNFSYAPTPGFSGNDAFTYKANDGGGLSSNTASVALTVNSVAVTPPPVVTPPPTVTSPSVTVLLTTLGVITSPSPTSGSSNTPSSSGIGVSATPSAVAASGGGSTASSSSSASASSGGSSASSGGSSEVRVSANESGLSNARVEQSVSERRVSISTLGNTSTIASNVATVGVQAPKAFANAAQVLSVAEQLQLVDIKVAKSQSNFSALLGDIVSGGRIRIEGVSNKGEAQAEQAKNAQSLLTTLSVHKSAQITGAAASTGLVVWALNSGGLLSSVLATVPVWKDIDPISILDHSDGESQGVDEEDDEVDETAVAEILS
ncbi:MAG: cadherin domain-containing protein [Methylophilaceae bacterium]